MKQKHTSAFLYAFLNPLATLGMIAVNILSIQGLGGRTTSELSALYESPITPAGFTFSIWSVIYTLVIIFSIIPLVRTLQGKKTQDDGFERIGWLYSLSCVMNAVWLIAWHREALGLSVIIMITLLVTLIQIFLRLKGIKSKALTTHDRWCTKPLFSMYMGWISVATIVNIAAWTVSISWDGWGISPITWTVILIGIATLLAFSIFAKYKTYPYVLVIIWALVGILVKNSHPDAIASHQIVLICMLCIGFLGGVVVNNFLNRKV